MRVLPSFVRSVGRSVGLEAAAGGRCKKRETGRFQGQRLKLKITDRQRERERAQRGRKSL